MNHLITVQFELTTPYESFAESMKLAKDKASEILTDLSKEAGIPIELKRIDPLPEKA